MPDETPLLELRAIRHAYGRHTVIDELSLTLARGRIACLLGPSGCGKTTVLRSIAGFEPILAGEIHLAGAVVSRPGHRVAPEKRRIGMVFQDYALFPHLDAEGNVGFGLAHLDRSSRRMHVHEALRAVGLEDKAHRYPHELSGGQQQRVALARALAAQPRLVLLDEPFSSLDVELRERLASEVRSLLQEQGMTAVMVTHDQHEAFAMADEIGVMHDGRILQWDTPYNLYHRPAHRFVADFVGEGAFVRGHADAGGRIALELGPLCGCTQYGGLAQPRPSQPVDVLLRPDDVVHDDASPVRALVVKKAFRGAQILYTLRLTSGAQILSLVPSHQDHPLGEAIGVRLDADHVVAFPIES
ncbi:MAG: ABC transporter ATP-binding protein [Burkholderiales bacterium]|nr:ABC transporter ATP-binding protein [Burkholderiales bacterium]